ncbi:dioxygenase [Robertmurraya massiliosenegalensis]|uniref:dioxygenase family protein n=1 Tax=Robertmurraya TaxID=2837507 RepID=UPI0039A4FEF3
MNERLLILTEALSKEVKKVINDYKVTEQELLRAIDFLNETGKQNEFHLLSDVLGISVEVNELTHGVHHDHHENTTSYNVEGPLYRDEAPLLNRPVKLCGDDEPGEILLLSGQVLSSKDGSPLANAILDVWQANEHGYYENQDPDQEEFNLRGRLQTDEEGRYEFKTILPGAYEIGRGGPVGEFLKAQARHAWRPAHIHFKVTAEDHTPLTTMLFVPDDPYIDSDTIGAVKDSLILKLNKSYDEELAKSYHIKDHFFISSFDFILRAK